VSKNLEANNECCEEPKHLDLFLIWLVADNFGVLNRVPHAMGNLSSTLVRFTLGRGAKVARIGMNRSVMEGIGTNSPVEIPQKNLMSLNITHLNQKPVRRLVFYGRDWV
jgi:hypothetical protein